MKHIFLSILFVASLLSCTNQNADQTAPPTIDSLVVKRDTSLVIKDHKGVYNINSNTIILCDDTTSIPVIDETKSLDTLIQKLFLNEVQPVYIEVKAIVQPKHFVIKEVFKAEQKNFRNTCISYDFWCVGTEPFWNIQISKTENLIDFYDPMEQKNYHFEYSDPKNEKNGIVYTAKNNTDKIQITIKAEACSDGMSERDYQHAAEINLNGNTFKGCAIKYGETIE
ncbi:MAG: hypothetical protein J0L87_06305 [Bacteroidetes bacterium]|nr:hypothetical protein [Bacteroidota bacterium]